MIFSQGGCSTVLCYCHGNNADIDECVRGENCSDIPHSHCVNLPGGYECVCDEGFRNDGSDICKGNNKERLRQYVHTIAGANEG